MFVILLDNIMKMQYVSSQQILCCNTTLDDTWYADVSIKQKRPLQNVSRKKTDKLAICSQSAIKIISETKMLET